MALIMGLNSGVNQITMHVLGVNINLDGVLNLSFREIRVCFSQQTFILLSGIRVRSSQPPLRGSLDWSMRTTAVHCA